MSKLPNMEVWKYDLPWGEGNVQIPQGGQILSAGIQHGEARMWVLVDPDAPKKEMKVKVVPTGQTFEAEGMKFVGTLLFGSGDYVLHVFVERLLVW